MFRSDQEDYINDEENYINDEEDIELIMMDAWS